jgi:hypothetical protein
MAQMAGAANVRQQRVLRDGKILRGQNRVVERGKLAGDSADLGTDAGTEFRRGGWQVDSLVHRCNYTLVSF